jgi:hypothetical protein
MPKGTPNWRYRQAERVLREGKIPNPHHYIEGLEDLVLAFNLVPHIDVFIPPKGFEYLSKPLRAKIRRHFRYCRDRRTVTELDNELLRHINYERNKNEVRQQADGNMGKLLETIFPVVDEDA